MAYKFKKGQLVRCVGGPPPNVPMGSVGVVESHETHAGYIVKWFAYPEATRWPAAQNKPYITLYYVNELEAVDATEEL